MSELERLIEETELALEFANPFGRVQAKILSALLRRWLDAHPSSKNGSIRTPSANLRTIKQHQNFEEPFAMNIYIVGVGAMLITAIAAAFILPSALAMQPSKLGWMEDMPFSDSDRARLAALSGQGFDSNLSSIRAMQGGFSGDLTRRDFELLRQDRRRARAAYPNVDQDKLFNDAWFNVPLSSKVPDSFCTSGNSNGTQGDDGKWYLDGGCYMATVRPEFTKRASPEETKAFFVALKAKETADTIKRLQTDGYMFSAGGSGGSLSVDCTSAKGCVVTQADEWASKGHEYRFPYVPEEWASQPFDMDAIRKVSSFARAIVKVIDVQPSGVTMTSGNGQPFPQGGTLMPGQSVTVGGSVPMPISQ